MRTSLPFGDSQSCSGSDPSPLHFAPSASRANLRDTGKQRDTETGLDNFNARYYASTAGRFMSPDWSARPQGVPYAQLGDPQSLNLYVYVRDNPITGLDLDGHCSKHSAKCSVTTPPGQGLDTNGTTTNANPSSPGAQRQIGPDYTPSGGNETLAVTAGRINDETNGMKDSKNENMSLSDAGKLMAHQRFNAERHYGKNVQKRAGMMAPLMHGPGYERALAATIAAAREAARGVDPTHGAFQYNMRTPAQVAGGRPFEGQSVQTVSGPYISPSKYTYIVTYWPDQ